MKIGDHWISLNALSTFEAAARHGHMGRAAEELSVTQSAISHQVRGLEETLGVKLFERSGRGVRVTHEGVRLMRAVQDGLDGISSTALAIQSDEYSRELTIMAPVSFMTEWLVPELSAFLETYPRLSMNCRIAERDIATIPPDVDVAIAYDRSRFEGRLVSPLLSIKAFPVCSPRLPTGMLPLGPEIIRGGTLIHEDDGKLWHQWFAAKGIEPIAPRRDIYAGSQHDALAFARRGAGFAMTDLFLGREEIGSGILVQPFGRDAVEVSHYFIATRRGESQSSPAIQLTRCLKREVGKITKLPVLTNA